MSLSVEGSSSHHEHHESKIEEHHETHQAHESHDVHEAHDASSYTPPNDDKPGVELKPDPPPATPPGWPKGPLAPSNEVNPPVDPQVETMQGRLAEQGYLDGAAVNGQYGQATTEAVSDFQLANGLTPTGTADEATLARMGSPDALTEAQAVEALAGRPERVISQIAGVPGPSPKPALDANALDPRIDTRLQGLGYLPPGASTDARAIKNFQAMNKLPVTGDLDQPTLNAMWSPTARRSFQVLQFQDDTYNATKLAGTGRAGGDNNCGPTSVGMALASVGLVELDNADPQALVTQMRADTGIPQPGLTGTTDLEQVAQKHGAQTYQVNDMDEVKLALMRGDPVSVFGKPNQGGTVYNAPASEGHIDPGAGHWVAVVGYDPKSDTFIVNDPLCRDGTLQLTQQQLATYADFQTRGVAVHAPPRPAPFVRWH